MLKKYIKLLLIIAVMCICFISCSSISGNTEVKENIDNGIDFAKGTLDKAKEIITGDNTSDKVIEKYKDIKKVSEFNLNDMVIGIEEAGYKVTIIAKEKDFFDAPKFKLIVGESYIQAYDYEELITLKKDISAITENGLKISGSDIKWNYTPHYFSKGEILVIYDGDSKDILNMLGDIFSDELF